MSLSDGPFIEEWRERITRLRTIKDMAAPWDVEPDPERWKSGLGVGPNSEDVLNAHMLEWQVWLRSLSSEDLAAYQEKHPEPFGWGLYRLTFSRPASVDVLEDKRAEVYWDAMLVKYCA